MTPKTRLLACVMLSLCAAQAIAASPTYTTMIVKDMHCADCAKKIARKLYALPGVKEVRADVKKNTAYVVANQGEQLSPKAMWEAVEAAGFKMVKMTGPGGSFTSKPKG
ncbi:MAG: heavy-metal-associated domain-containing protein [Planctomycetales bacterium]|nr:heavy-metal-associated domain-containing protein [Planctomycetales bacterium]